MIRFWLGTGFLMFSSALILAQEIQETPAESQKLGIDLETAYVSRYMWQGYVLFDDHAALQPGVTWNLFDTGFSLNVWGSIPMGTGSFNDSGGINQWQELDYTAAYEVSFFEEQPWQVDVGTKYLYYHFPKLNHLADCQETGLSIGLPNAIRCGPIPIAVSYYGAKLWPTSSGVDDVAGGYHVLCTSADFDIPWPGKSDKSQTFTFCADLTYNDGIYNADHDWSHVTMGLSTDFDLEPFTVSPFLNYQISMDDSVNTENELYGGVSVSISF